MLIDFVCKYNKRHQAYKDHLLCLCKDLMGKTKNKAQRSLWSQHLLRQNNSAQPQTRPITSTPFLRLQINLIRVYFVSSLFLPPVLVSTAAVPQNSGLSWLQESALEDRQSWRSLLRVSVETTQILDFTLWSASWTALCPLLRLIGLELRKLKTSTKIKVIVNPVVAKHTTGNVN